MDFTYFVKREHHKALAWLGKKPWVTVKTRPPESGGGIHLSYRWPPHDAALTANEYELIESIEGAARNGNDNPQETMRVLNYRILSSSLANGPKMFQPTPIQCEALENVDIDVPFSDYRQPYEVLAVQIPEDYRKSAMTRMMLEKFPTYILVHHDMVTGTVLASAFYARENSTVSILAPETSFTTVEDQFRKLRLQGQPEIDCIMQRLAMNLCLLMTQYRVRTRPLDKQHVEKLQGLARKKDPEKAARARSMLAAEINVVEFEQEVKFYDEEDDQPREHGGSGEPTGMVVKPHWRRGHWRRQFHGASWVAKYRMSPPQEQARMGRMIDDSHHHKFIRPVLVRRDRFKGDTSNTSAVYNPNPARPHRGYDAPSYSEGYGG
jgi:hypothetical protein